MTVIEIAQKAGVSIGTVDRVIHNRGRVSPATKEKIQRIIDEEGYQPNPLARHLRRNEQITIGVLLPRQKSESGYWQLVWNGLEKAVAEFSAFSFSFRQFEFERPNVPSLQDAFERMEKARCSVWIIAPIMQEECLRLVTGASDPRPYICIDSPLPGAEPRATISQDPFRGGYLAGRLMSILAPSRDTFGIIRPYTEAYNLNERARGFTEWFKDSQVLDIVCPQNSRSGITSALDGVFKENPDLAGLFCVSSMAHQVADYLVKRDLKKRITLIGYDLVPENEDQLRSGKIDCLISQRPEEQGRLAIQEVYKEFVLQEPGGKAVPVPLDVFFKENLL